LEVPVISQHPFVRGAILKAAVSVVGLSTLCAIAGCASQSAYDAKVAELELTKNKLADANRAEHNERTQASKLREQLALAQAALRTSGASLETLQNQLASESQRSSELTEALSQQEQAVLALQRQLAGDQALLVEFQRLAASYGAETPDELNQMIAALGARVGATERQLELAAQDLARERRLSAKLQHLIDAGKLRVRHRAGRLVIELPGDIHFASGSARLTPDGEATLAELSPILSAEQDRLFVVEGHTDDVPIKVSGFRSNWHLGATRAEMSRDALVKAGMNSQRVAIATWADLLPACADVQDDECRKRNRRVEVLVLPRFE
jgi:chemotaxis protein MotB